MQNLGNNLIKRAPYSPVNFESSKDQMQTSRNEASRSPPGGQGIPAKANKKG
jgi:hypothetical protein